MALLLRQDPRQYQALCRFNEKNSLTCTFFSCHYFVSLCGDVLLLLDASLIFPPATSVSAPPETRPLQPACLLGSAYGFLQGSVAVRAWLKGSGLWWRCDAGGWRENQVEAVERETARHVST